MWLTKVAISRRVTMSMVILGLVVLGFVGMTRMPLDFLPKIEIPVVTITVPYPGAGPEEIEQRIVRPLEDTVSTISGVDEVSSVSQENLAAVTISFLYGTNLDVAASDVRDALDRAKALFPSGAKQPSLYKLDVNQRPILSVGITGKRPPDELRKLIEDEVAPSLGQVNGTAAVTVTGGRVREIQVLADRRRLEAVGLSVGQLAQALQAQNLNVPGGSIKQGLREYVVRVMGEFGSTEEIRRLRINTPLGGTVRLDQIAAVLDTTAEASTISRINGRDSVNLSIYKQSDANTVEVARGAKEKLAAFFGDKQKAIAGSLPPDLEAVIAYDGSEQVLESIADVRDALIYGALLAAIVAFLFLHTFRATIVIALAIPTSMMATFLPIGLGMGFTLNMMVMLGLALSVGILIDDSIVVLENITRHLEMGEQPKAAAYNGRTEIGAAAVAITLVDVVVFVPVALMGGIVGQFFYAFGLTVATCTLFSLFISFTLTPMLAAWWFERREKSEQTRRTLTARAFAAGDRLYDRLAAGYARRLLGPAVRHPWVTLLLAYGALIGFLVLLAMAPRLGLKALSIPFEFQPHTDAGEVSLSIETGVGTRLAETDRVIAQIEERLADRSRYPEIRNVSVTVGQGSGGGFGVGNAGGQYGVIQLDIGRRRARLAQGGRTDQALVAALRKDLADIPSATIKISAGADRGPGGAPVELNVLNENQQALGQAAVAIAQKLQQIPGLLYVDLSSKPGRPELRANIDRVRVADYGLTVAEVAFAVRAAFQGDTSTKYREGGDEFDLRVQLAEQDRMRISDAPDLLVGFSRSRQAVRLRDVADVALSTGPSKIERYNRQRLTKVSAFLDEEVIRMGAARSAVEAAIKETNLRGSTYEWSGSMKMMAESFGRMGSAMLLALVLVYMMTAGLYNSVLEPLNVMLTIPIALVGGLIGLVLCHMSLSIISMIGFIMLLGLVGKNAILVVDYTNTLRGRGMTRTEALMTAGPHRMRPVLMTTLAAVSGMLPTALAINEGSEFRAPMAVVVIFGLLLATMVSLVIVPASYVVWDNVGNLGMRLGRLIRNGLYPQRRRGEGATKRSDTEGVR